MSETVKVLDKNTVVLLAQPRIRFMRDWLGWSQAEVAAHVESSQALISRYESGSLNMPKDKLLKLFLAYADHVCKPTIYTTLADKVNYAAGQLQKAPIGKRTFRKDYHPPKEGIVDKHSYNTITFIQLGYRTAEELAKGLGLHVQSAYKLMQGKTRVSQKHLSPLYAQANRYDLIRFMQLNEGKKDLGPMLIQAFIEGDAEKSVDYVEAQNAALASNYQINLDDYDI